MAHSGPRNTSIQLTQQEKELFGILLKTLEHQRLNTVLRCAGGWVRDKLLGKDSHDIDIAIDNKLGGEFAEYVNSYLSSQDIKTRKVRQNVIFLCCYTHHLLFLMPVYILVWCECTTIFQLSRAHESSPCDLTKRCQKRLRQAYYCWRYNLH